MGWKAECIIVSERGPGHVVKQPAHNPERARELITKLDLGPFQTAQPDTFDRAMNPASGVFSIGAYDGAFILCDDRLCGTVENPSKPEIRKILDAFPGASMLALELQSVTNYFGYALFENGTLQRAYGGDSDRSVQIDSGAIQPEEQPYFDKSVVRDGKRFFVAEIGGADEEFDASEFGEELAFAMAARFFGEKLDSASLDLEQFQMESFQKLRTSKPWWQFWS